MSNTPQPMARLFKRRVVEFPSYSEFITLLATNNNTYNNNMLAHFHNDGLKVFIYVMQDHLKFISNAVYDKVTQNLPNLWKCVEQCCDKHWKEKECLFLYLGIQGREKSTQSFIATTTKMSKTTVNRTLHKLSMQIRETINRTLFPEVVIGETLPRVTREDAKQSLYTTKQKELGYDSLRASMQERGNQYTQNVLKVINNRGLRAAVGSFRGCPRNFTEQMYNCLVQRADNLETSIVHHVRTNFNKTDANIYFAYWQLAEFANHKSMTPEAISDYHKQSIQTIRRHLNRIAESVNKTITTDILGEKPEPVKVDAYVCRPVDPESEKLLISKIIEIFNIHSTVAELSSSPKSLIAIGELFSHYSPTTAITGRMMLSGYSIPEVKEELKRFGINNDAIQDGSFRNRKARFITALMKDFHPVRMNNGVSLVYTKG